MTDKEYIEKLLKQIETLTNKIKTFDEDFELLRENNFDLRKDMEFFKTELFNFADAKWNDVMSDKVTGFDGMVCLGQWRLLNELIKQLGLDFDYAQHRKE